MILKEHFYISQSHGALSPLTKASMREKIIGTVKIFFEFPVVFPIIGILLSYLATFFSAVTCSSVFDVHLLCVQCLIQKHHPLYYFQVLY